MTATRYLPAYRRRIVVEWADELATVLGRPAAEIAERGLGAYDFKPRAVRVRFDDGSEARYEYAFFVASEAKGAIAIFTEHCGYFVVHLSDDVAYAPDAPAEPDESDG